MQPRSDPTVCLHLRRRVVAGLLLMLAAPWVLIAAAFVGRDAVRDLARVWQRVATGDEGRRSHGHAGPWGALEYVRIAIEPPAELGVINPWDEAPPRWVFKGFSKEQLAGFFRTAGLSESNVRRLAGQTSLDPVTGAAVINPPADLVLAMSPTTRARIYTVLARFPENEAQRTPFTLRSRFLDERFEESGLPAQLVADIKRLLYPHQDLLLFADWNVILPRLPDRRMKLRVLRTMARKNTFLMKLQVGASSDVEELTAYWGVGGRAKDVRPLLESLKRVPGGARLDIAHLLPGFARQRLYTYPYPSTSEADLRKDCHWTSLNFFNAEPDDRYTDPMVAVPALEACPPVTSAPRFGDLVLFMSARGLVVHSAVYIADDVAFTKNGPMPTHPWMLMQIEDLRTLFSACYPDEGDMMIKFCRRGAG